MFQTTNQKTFRDIQRLFFSFTIVFGGHDYHDCATFFYIVISHHSQSVIGHYIIGVTQVWSRETGPSDLLVLPSSASASFLYQHYQPTEQKLCFGSNPSLQFWSCPRKGYLISSIHCFVLIAASFSKHQTAPF